MRLFEIKVLFCAPLGCTHIETLHPGIFLCTPLVEYCNENWVKKCAHIGRTRPKNVHLAVEICAPGAECTLNFEHCEIIQYSGFLQIDYTTIALHYFHPLQYYISRHNYSMNHPVQVH